MQRSIHILTLASLLLLPAPGCDLFAREYVIVIDPGHGGARASAMRDERWDPVSGEYLSFYSPGMIYKNYTEQRVVLGLAKQLKKQLELTQTDAGWKKFEELLKSFSGQKSFERVKFKVLMTREDSWSDRNLPPTHPEVNAPYRLYDYPDPRKKGRMLPGRISFINSQKPYLVLSLHLNPAGKGHDGGMAAVLSPGFETFDAVRQIDLNRRPMSWFDRSPWKPTWLITDPGWSKYLAARSDAWVYFHGYRKTKNGNVWRSKNRGFRHNLFDWRYKEKDWVAKARKGGPGPYSIEYEAWKPDGPFWDRERAEPEQWRREGGKMGFGGDNHLASDELMRFIQHGVRLQVPALRKPGAVGPILPPFTSTYTLPTYVNAICAFLEIGHLNRERDRVLTLRYPTALTRSLAVGVYSLFAGLEVRKTHGPYKPRGEELNWDRYEDYDKGNYFEIVSD